MGEEVLGSARKSVQGVLPDGKGGDPNDPEAPKAPVAAWGAPGDEPPVLPVLMAGGAGAMAAAGMGGGQGPKEAQAIRMAEAIGKKVPPEAVSIAAAAEEG